MKKILFVLVGLVGVLTLTEAQITPESVIRRAEDKLRGTSNIAELKMSIVRPKWTREITMKAWSLGDEYSLTLIQSPKRDQGIVFLKRGKEIWNWQPTIERMIKLPPSMMMQSWMGSDFTNDDLVRQSSLVDDFTQSFLDEETIEDRACYVIELIPRENAAVVWGKVIMWIDKSDFLQLKTEFYDEDEYLVNTIYGREITELGGKVLPRKLEVIPNDEDGNKTIIEYIALDFDTQIQESFFSVQNAKRVK